ncbi:MAG: hypothetical protein U5K30_07790 [Acidimicrobiales bacterium]|nr:hypothetical protein [Acidimicrobiales bacterium]
MIETPDYDPVFGVRLRHEHPEVRPTHRQFARLVHEHDVDELRSIDAELDTLMARRRAVTERLAALRPRMWPATVGRHRRRPPRLTETPCPPAPVDAEPVSGVELRHLMVAVLQRYGPLPLRELHGLLHRLGYVVDSKRPVQRLGDAAAYEVREGRLGRVARGVYEALVDDDPAGRVGLEASDPLPWAEPDPEVAGDEPFIDPGVAWDPERWSGGAWPSATQLGSPPQELPLSSQERSLAADLHATNRAARHRMADLVADRLGPPRPRFSPPHTDWFSPIGGDSSTNRRQEPRTSDYEGLVFDDDEMDGDPEPPDERA